MGEIIAIAIFLIISIIIGSSFSKKQKQSVDSSQKESIRIAENKNSNSSVIKTILIVGSIILLALTNPKENEHKEKLTNTFTRSLSNNTDYGDLGSGGLESLGSSLGLALGDSFISIIMSSLISVENYVLFSLTKVNVEQKSKTIGIGVLGNVYIFNEATRIIEESTKSAGKKLKDSNWK